MKKSGRKTKSPTKHGKKTSPSKDSNNKKVASQLQKDTSHQTEDNIQIEPTQSRKATTPSRKATTTRRKNATTPRRNAATQRKKATAKKKSNDNTDENNTSLSETDSILGRNDTILVERDTPQKDDTAQNKKYQARGRKGKSHSKNTSDKKDVEKEEGNLIDNTTEIKKGNTGTTGGRQGIDIDSTSIEQDANQNTDFTQNEKDTLSIQSKRGSVHMENNDTLRNKDEPPKKKQKKEKKIWTFIERCCLVEALDTGMAINDPKIIAKYTGQYKLRMNQHEAKRYKRYYCRLEQGRPFEAFKDKAPLDCWIELAKKHVRKDDKRAEECIPQIMTVAALEKQNSLQKTGLLDPLTTPNFANAYNFLSMLLKGEEAQDLPPIDAQVVLSLLDGLVENLANSFTMLQKEFLHHAFEVLSKETETADMSSESETRTFPSLNPLNVPQNLLEFKKK